MAQPSLRVHTGETRATHFEVQGVGTSQETWVKMELEKSLGF